MAFVAKEVFKYWQYNLVLFRVLFLSFYWVIFLVRAEDRLQWINKLMARKKKTWYIEATIWGNLAWGGERIEKELFICFFKMQEIWVHFYAGEKIAPKRTRLMMWGLERRLVSRVLEQIWQAREFKAQREESSQVPPLSTKERGVECRCRRTAQGHVLN